MPKQGRMGDSGLLIKICGLTRVDNALGVARAGADLIGLVFFPKSPRNVSPDRAREIACALPHDVGACGVFVDADYDAVQKTAEHCRLKAVQLHGTESPDMAAKLSEQGLLVIKAFFAARHPKLDTVADYPCIDFYLAEYGKGILPGGNAESWDYGMVRETGGRVPLMLAGGLSPDNVARAIAQASARGVDASSSLESEPGLKDLDKVKTFIRNARAAAPGSLH